VFVIADAVRELEVGDKGGTGLSGAGTGDVGREPDARVRGEVLPPPLPLFPGLPPSNT